MYLIITMAGESRRFKRAGITTPKYELRIGDRTMFNYALRSLAEFHDESFVFVTREAQEASGFLERECASLGIDDYRVVELDGPTDGQATTALRAGPYVPDDAQVAIYNIDTYIEPPALSKAAVAESHDGYIPAFKAEGDHWSFVRTDDRNVATEVVEKERISDLATVGFYAFGRWDDFIAAYEACGEATENEFGEKYIAPLYNWLIERSRQVDVEEIPGERVHILGTPAEVVEFHPPFAREHGLDG